MDLFDRLSVEVRRITTCPYTPNLKEIHEVVQKADASLLQRWARGNPCQIDSLTTSVLEGLELWPYALDLLRILSCIPAFRNAALQQKPTLLHILLTKAIESDRSFDKFSPPCVSMLSAALTVAVPSNVPIFLESLLEKAVQSRSPEAIRSVNQTLSGLGTSYLDKLAPDSLARFQSHLTELLTKLDMDDPFANLLCLAVLAKFASRPCGPPDNFAPARKYFVGKRAQKTFDLAILKVINACSRSSILSSTGTLETLALSEEIVDALSSDEKKSRVGKNSGMTRNLYAKILRPDIDKSLQAAALNFVTAMSDGQELPVELKPTFKKVLLAPTTVTLSLRTLTSCFVRAPAVIIQETCSYLQESLGTPVISESVLGLLCLACATSSPSSDTLARFDCGLRMASAIVTLAPNFDDLRQAILEYLTKNDTSALLHQFATQEPPRIDFSCGQGLSNICPSTYDETRIRLHQRLTVMILSIGLHSSPCDAGLGAVLAILLDKQTKLSSLKFLCTACPSYKSQLQTSALSLFEAGSTPQMQGVSQNWRENLARELSRDVNRQHESVTRLIGEICRDLELRCSEAERPFREEQSRSRDLQAKLEDSQIRVDELEVQAQSQRSELDDLRNDKNSLKEQADSCEERLKDLGKKLEQMHQDFDQSKRHHERATQAALESSRQRDLDCMAIVAGKDLVLDEQAIKLAASEGRIYELEDELAQQQSRALQDAETIKGDKARIQELHTDVASAKELAALKQVEIDRLTASEARLIETKEQLAKEAQDNAHRHEILISDQHNQLKAEKDRSAELRQRHEDFAGTKDAEIQRLEDSHRSSDERLQAALEEARTSAAIADQENILQITDLKKGIKQLRKEREERAQEVSEAKALKHGFMAFMGNINDQPGLAGKQSRTSIPDIGTGSPEQPAPGSNLVSSFGTGTSSRSGPTPKRTKRHRVSSHVPTSKAAQPDGDTRSVRHRVLGPPRSPLKELGTARSSGQLTPTQRIRWDKPARNENAEPRAMQENLEAQGWNSDDESFGGGDIFTSTDQRQLSALRSRTPLKSPRAGFDETTTEF